MLGKLNGLLLTGVLAAVAGLGLGLKLGADHEARKCETKITAVRKAAEEVINAKLQEILTLQAEKAQALDEVEKVNATTRKQFEELQLLLTADQAKREEAAGKVEKAATQAARDAREAAARATEARKVIQNVADKCATAAADPEFVRMLDSILAPTP